MDYIHIRNLQKFHPGYKDRTLQFAKIFINMADGDPDTELIENEIDWARFIKMILLELRAQKPLPNLDTYWAKKGFDLKKRPMSKTIQMLQNFIEIVTEDLKERNVDKDKEKEKEKEKKCVTHLSDEEFIQSLKTKEVYKGIDINRELGKMDGWLSIRPGRQKTRRFIVAWLNKVDKPIEITKPEPKPEPQPKFDPEQHKAVSKLIHETAEKLKTK